LKDAPSELLFFFFHALIYIGSLLAVWAVQKRLACQDNHSARRAMKLILGFVVFVAVVVNTCVMNHIIRRTTAEDARKSITKTNTLTASLLVSPKDALLSSLVIRDQAVTKIASQIYTVIRDDYPEMDLKAVSVHLIPKTRYSDQIWNFVQVGRETRDMEHLDRVKKDGSPGSLIAAAIINNRLRPAAITSALSVSRYSPHRETCRLSQESV
jgi:hypothetical protein